MPSASVRISEETRETLRELAHQEGESMQAILDKAVESYRRQKFLDDANAAFAALKSNPEAWKEELDERKLWDQTLNDGLNDK